MAKKPIFKTLWAERGAKEEVDSSKIAVGWTAERPPFQWENWSQWRQDAFISHINEKGLPEWDDFTAYGTSGKSYVLGSNGEVYVSTAPSGGTYPASDPTEATTTKWKKAWLDSDGTIGIPRVVGLVAALDNKVDKVAGKALSANDFTNAYKGKLDGIESNAQRNVATNLSNKRAISSVTLESSTGEGTIIPTASASLAGVLSGTDKAKLDSLPSGVAGIVPLSGGGTGSSNAAGARLALQLGAHVTHPYGTEANTVMMGNDPRLVGLISESAEGLSGKADKVTTINTGAGLLGGGSLGANRTLTVNFGSVAGTVAQGNDPRLLNAIQNNRVVQATGQSTTNIMSQKAVTDALGSTGVADKNNILFSGATRAKVEFDHIQCSGNSVVTEYASPYAFSSFMYRGGFSCKNTKSGSNYVHYLPHGVSVVGSATPNIMEFTSFNGSSPNSVEFKGTVHVNKGIFATESIGTSSFMHMYSLQIRKANNSIVAQVDNNGIGNFVDVNITSDERYKGRKEKITGALDKAYKLSGFTYDLYSEVDCSGDNLGRSAGILAQDLKEVLPESVSEGEDGKLTVSYSGVTALLLEAIKELTDRVNSLEDELRGRGQ